MMKSFQAEAVAYRKTQQQENKPYELNFRNSKSTQSI